MGFSVFCFLFSFFCFLVCGGARLVRRGRLDDLTVLYLGCCCAPVVRPPSAWTDWCARLVRRSRLDDHECEPTGEGSEAGSAY